MTFYTAIGWLGLESHSLDQGEVLLLEGGVEDFSGACNDLLRCYRMSWIEFLPLGPRRAYTIWD